MNIQWTEPAVNDFEAIREFIARDSDVYASGFIEKIISAVDIVANFPELGRQVPEADTPDIRELIFQKYRIIYSIIYRIHQSGVQIISVIHGSRDISGTPIKPWEII